MSVTLADAKRMIEAGEKKAGEIGQPMNIAVADPNLASDAKLFFSFHIYLVGRDLKVNLVFEHRLTDTDKHLAWNGRSGAVASKKRLPSGS